MQTVVDYFKTLVPIGNPSGQEATIRAFIQERLHGWGFTQTQVDTAGNLFVRIPGDPARETLLLSAHMDSVPPCEGIEPVEDTLDGRAIIRSTGKTILGADDKSGIATILAICERLHQEGGMTHHPLELLFSTGEEVGLLGAKAFDMSQVQATMGFVLDGEGNLGDVFSAGPTQYNLLFELTGKSAHAGISPEDGVNAIAMAANLCSQLPSGRLSPNTTMNLGTIVGGAAMNIVPEHVTVRGEARSHDDAALQALLQQVEATCQAIESRYPGGQIRFIPSHRYQHYEVPATHPAVEKSIAACRALGVEPHLLPMNIGSDAHILNHAGLMTVVLGMGFHFSHSLGEFISVDELKQVATLVWELIHA